MILLVCGDRFWKDNSFITEILRTYLPDWVHLIHGDCRGADRMAAASAKLLRVPLISAYPARWTTYGLAAGPIRNRVMLDQQPDLVVGFHDALEHSTGTRDCLVEASDRTIPVHHYGHQGSRDGVFDTSGRWVAFVPF